jgi:dihydrofolate synthase/folylpolyglutamate synthase
VKPEPKIMTYTETIDFLYSQLPVFHRIGKAAYKANLNNTLALDNHFDHPHHKFKSVHIAGTNGKGSVSHIIASVLQEAGYTTALYTSPHLKDYRERIRINGAMIPEAEVIAFVENHTGIIRSVNPSFFEMSVAMAFEYFAKEKVDVGVIETGLGGRLDSTNIITPLLSIITNIGHDHMDLLGDTLEKIAVEKAGIIKKNVPVIIGETLPETRNIFSERAVLMESDLFFASEIYDCILQDPDMLTELRKFILRRRESGELITGESALLGDYQKSNLQIVISAVEILKDHFHISRQNIIDGISKVILNTGLRGRWQILGRDPLIVCDTGHNIEGLAFVMNQIAGIPKSALHLVIGFVRDKDLRALLSLFPEDATYYFTKASVPRALDEKILQSEALKFGLKGNIFPGVMDAFAAAKENASKDEMIFIGGSTFVVAEVL